MRQIWEITRKDLYLTFTDRNLLLLMFAAPLLLATIIAVTFGGVSSGDAPIQNIPVAIVNLDEGANDQNFGQVIAEILARPQDYDAETSTDELDTLINGTLYATTEEALRAVETLEANAAVIIPQGFTAGIMPKQDINIMGDSPIDGAVIEVHANPMLSLSRGIVEGVVNGITSQIAAGNVTAAAIIQALIETGQVTQIVSVTESDAFLQGITGQTDGAVVTVERQTTAGQAVTFNPLVLFGASQAIFFALFTANAAATNVIEERRNYTLQRLMVAPMPRGNVLLGKMLGTFVTVFLQLVFLFIGFTVVASLLSGEFTLIWGTDWFGIFIVTFAASLSATGLGTIVASAARTPDQASTFGIVIAMLMAILGGGFGFQLGPPMQYFSVIYWGTNAYTKLAAGVGDYWLNVAVLTLVGIVTFGIGLVIFFRRIRNWS